VASWSPSALSSEQIVELFVEAQRVAACLQLATDDDLHLITTQSHAGVETAIETLSEIQCPQLTETDDLASPPWSSVANAAAISPVTAACQSPGPKLVSSSAMKENRLPTAAVLQSTGRHTASSRTSDVCILFIYTSRSRKRTTFLL